jgi:uncharacterized membrane protein
MLVVFILIGAMLGAMLAELDHPLFGAVLGALGGIAIGEFRALRKKLREVRQDLADLQQAVGRLTQNAAAPLAAAESQPVVVAEPGRPPEQDEPLPAGATEIPVALALPGESLGIDPYDTAGANPSVDAASAARPRQPPAPRRPNPLIAAIVGFFTGGNTLVRSGIVVLFFGVAFLLRYAAENSHVSIELRLSGVALAAVVFLVLGWRLRKRRAGYAFALQGGAVGILYLTVFAAMRIYSVLPPSLAFSLLVLIGALAAALAVLQDSQAFALLGVTGGFLAPVLAASGQGSHVVLFSYFLVLNAGIVAIAWFKSWRPLNLCGFLFTFAIATAWGVLKYKTADFSTTEPFLIAFFFFYLAISVLFALRQPLELRGYVDGTLVFGTPFVAFGLQSAMLHHDSMALAYSALGMSGVYLLLAFALRRLRDPKQAVLIESFLALGVIFLTLAIPLALGNRMNSAAWSLEGAGLIFIGCRQGRRLARALGTLLIIAAAGLLLWELSPLEFQWTLPTGSYAGIVLVSVACLFAVKQLAQVRDRLHEAERLYQPLLFVVGLLSWCIGTQGELSHWVAAKYVLSATLGFYALTALMLSALGRHWSLPYAKNAALLLLPIAYAFCVGWGVSGRHPAAFMGWLAWPLAFAAIYFVDYRAGADKANGLSTAYHALALWLLCIVAGWEASWQISFLVGEKADWHYLGWVLLPALLLLSLRPLLSRPTWPVEPHRHAYLAPASLGLAIAMSILILLWNAVLPGNSSPLPYLPLLNPLDVAQMLVLLALLRYITLLLKENVREPFGLPRAFLPALLALLAFDWGNGVLLRTLHHWFVIPFNLEALLASNMVETSISIFWSVLALVTMLVASRLRFRMSWIVGAGLLVVVVIKLFFVDLARISSIERIVSFVGVGLLMVIFGYFSPLPPRKPEPA